MITSTLPKIDKAIGLFLDSGAYADGVVLDILQRYFGQFDVLDDGDAFIAYKRVEPSVFEEFITMTLSFPDSRLVQTFGDDVIIFHAVSSGSDPYALLRLLKRLRRENPDVERIAWMEPDLTKVYVVNKEKILCLQ